MREIKFKMWDKLNKKMFDPSPLNLIEKVYFVRKDDLILLQYAGLKDKQGKEIYEGDILEFDDGFKGVVEFENGSFGVRRFGQKLLGLYHYWNFCKTNHSEIIPKIIGNKFKNPKLLEK